VCRTFVVVVSVFLLFCVLALDAQLGHVREEDCKKETNSRDVFDVIVIHFFHFAVFILISGSYLLIVESSFYIGQGFVPIFLRIFLCGSRFSVTVIVYLNLVHIVRKIYPEYPAFPDRKRKREEDFVQANSIARSKCAVLL